MNRLASPAQLRASYIRWALFLVPAVLLAGFLAWRIGGGVGTPWFEALDKPAILPAPGVFGIVSPLNYVLTGLSAALVCSAWGSRWRGLAMGFFVAQFALNLAWPVLFFGAHRMTVALAVMVALDLLLAFTLILFWKVRRLAALLLAPYLLWMLFVTVLNYEILRRNPDADGSDRSYAVQRIEL